MTPVTATAPSLAEEVDALVEQRRADIRADPYRVYRRLRDEAPVFLHRDVAWITRYADVEATLRDSGHFSSAGREGGTLYRAGYEALDAGSRDLYNRVRGFEGLWISHTDDPVHARLRALEGAALTPRRFAEMEAGIQVQAEQILAEMAAGGVSDAIPDLAYRLPLLVICDLIGVPPQDRHLISTWSEGIALRSDNDALARVDACIGEFRDYVRHLVLDKPVGSDVITALTSAEHPDGGLGDEELLASLVHMLFAAHETTSYLLGNGLYAMLKHPDQWRQIAADPSLLGNAVDEMLRYEAPVHTLDRVARSDVEIAGTVIPEGHGVVICLGSANRDPRQYADPDRFDIRRDVARIVGYGLGAHYCMGAPLARLEARIAFRIIADHYPNIEPAARLDELEWNDNSGLRGRGLKSLPVRLLPP